MERILKDVTRLFPFVLRARKLIIGRNKLLRMRSDLQLIIITTDISENSKKEMLKDFAPYPILQHFSSDDLFTHLDCKGTKVIGIAKSSLASSIYQEMKEYRINMPKPNTKPQAGKPEDE